MERKHLIVIANQRSMPEIQTGSVQLVITTPPSFCMKSDDAASQPKNFRDYLQNMQRVFNECHRVLENGCCICVNACDTINCRYSSPSPVHYVLLLKRAGFEYRNNIVWRRFAGIAESNILWHIIIMRKGGFDRKEISDDEKCQAIMDMQEAMRSWKPGTPFPDALYEQIINLYTYEGETVLDPFLGDGSITRASACLKRRSIGYLSEQEHLGLFRQTPSIIRDGLEIIVRRRFE